MAWGDTVPGQTGVIAHTGSGTMITATQPQDVVVGNTVLALAKRVNTLAGAEPDHLTLTTNLGNVPVRDKNFFLTDEFRIQIWRIPILFAGTQDLILTTTDPASALSVGGMEYEGVFALDQSAQATGTSAAADSGAPGTTVDAIERLFGIVGDNFNGTPMTATNSWTKRAESTSGAGRCGFFDRAVTSTGIYNLTATLANSTIWCAIMATYKAVASVGGQNPYPALMNPQQRMA